MKRGPPSLGALQRWANWANRITHNAASKHIELVQKNSAFQPKGNRKMAKAKTVSKSEQAANEVLSILRLITSGPRFTGHLTRISDANNLSPTSRKRLLKAAVKKFLG